MGTTAGWCSSGVRLRRRVHRLSVLTNALRASTTARHVDDDDTEPDPLVLERWESLMEKLLEQLYAQNPSLRSPRSMFTSSHDQEKIDRTKGAPPCVALRRVRVCCVHGRADPCCWFSPQRR
jgi:hypothetical protein